MAENTVGGKSPVKRKSPIQRAREKKLSEALEQLSQKEALVHLLNTERQTLAKADVTGQSVSHKQFGTGEISAQDVMTVTVRFPSGSKHFAFPGAFSDGFLKAESDSLKGFLTQYQALTAELGQAKNETAALSRTVRQLEQQLS